MYLSKHQTPAGISWSFYEALLSWFLERVQAFEDAKAAVAGAALLPFQWTSKL